MAVFSVNEIIELAVQIERNGYAYYNEASKRKDIDDKMRELIIGLRDAELSHEQTFLKLRDALDLQILELSGDWELIASYLKSIVDGRIFNDETSAIRRATEAKDIISVLEYAIRFEKDTLLYFHAINDGISDPHAKDTLRKIINEEVSHVIALNDFKKRIS